MDDYQATVIAGAIREAGSKIGDGAYNINGLSLTDEQWEMLPRGIVAAGELVANELRSGLFAIEGNSDEGRPGLVDGLFAISRSLSEVADAIKHQPKSS